MSDTSKHTRGPWRITESERSGGFEVVNDGGPIAGIYMRGISEDEAANASLIAAAPDQHVALRTISEGINAAIDNWAHWTSEQIREHLFGLQAVAQDAYDKAEGRS